MTVHGPRLTDVIVIGSGPAGCAAAATCAKAGIDVLIVTEEPEQNSFTSSDPVPLESIHPGVSSLLEKIGVPGAEVAATRAMYSGIYSNKNYSPLGEDSSGVWQGMHINRQIFNHELLQRIQDSGISIRFNEKVESFIKENNRVAGIKTASKELYADYIIDASGKNAVAGKKLNFKRRFYSPPLICSTGLSEIPETFPFDKNAAHFIPWLNGWTWLAPQPPGHCAWTMLTVQGEKSLLPPEELKDYPTIGKIRFANMRWRLFRPVCTESILLCGDAAGILDPAAGQGIFNALLSGIQAGQTVISCIQQPDFEAFHLAAYDDWFVQQFEMKVKLLRSYYEEQGINIIN